MIKWASTIFVAFLILLGLFAILTGFMPTLAVLDQFISFFLVALLATGIVLIIALIVDRFKESKRECDDYKKY